MMHKKQSLPFLKSNIKSFPYFALADSIFAANMCEGYKEYMLERFLNFNLDTQSFIFALLSEDDWGVNAGIIIHQKIEIYKTAFAMCGINMVDLFKRSLHSCLYIYGLRGANQEKYMITGYDDSKKAFEVWLFSNQIGLFKEWIGYDELCDSLFDVPRKSLGITFWKYNENHNYKLNLNNVSIGIREYLEGLSKDKNRVCGLFAIKELSSYCTKQAELQHQLDKRFFDGFAEHKVFMNERIKFLANNNMISVSYVQASQKNTDIANSVVELAKIYNESRKSEAAIKMALLIEESIHLEQEYLRQVLSEMKSFVERNSG